MLADEDIRVGTFVSGSDLGVGRIVEVVEDSSDIIVDFHSQPRFLFERNVAIRTLRKASEEGLEVRLHVNREAVLELVENAPLRLVAAALVDLGRSATTTELREKLTRDVIDQPNWNRWWRRVQAGLKESRRSISYSPRRKSMRLIANHPDDINPVSLNELSGPSSNSRAREVRAAPPRSVPRLSEWVMWIHGDEEGDVPRGAPPEGLRPVLQTCPSLLVSRSTNRLVRGIEQRVTSSLRPAGPSSMTWLGCLADILTRWVETGEHLEEIPLPKIIQLLAQATHTLDSAEYGNLAEWLTSYVSRSTRNVEQVARALLSADTKIPREEKGIGKILEHVSAQLEESTLELLYQSMIETNSYQPPDLGTWRSLKPEVRAEILSSVLVNVHDPVSITEVGHLLNREWGVSNPHERHYLFKPVAVAWLMHEQLRGDAGDFLRNALRSNLGGAAPESSHMVEWRDLSESLSNDVVAQLREELTREKESELQSRAATESELERVKRQVRHLRGELHNASRVAVLDLTRDALLVLGETVQQLVSSTAPDTSKIADAEAGIRLALGALGAELFGEVGQVIDFDSRLHEPDSHIAGECQVEVTAPGLRFTRGVDTPFVLVRAEVRAKE